MSLFSTLLFCHPIEFPQGRRIVHYMDGRKIMNAPETLNEINRQKVFLKLANIERVYQSIAKQPGDMATLARASGVSLSLVKKICATLESCDPPRIRRFGPRPVKFEVVK